MSAKTVFISYRRDASGKAFARLLERALHHEGYDVFLDVDDISPGKWANQILAEVPRRAHFLLVLTPGALDRCDDANDWVRREFELAVKSERNIVPVLEESVNLDKLHQECPESMKSVFDLEMATIRHQGFERDIEELIQRYIPPHREPRPTQPPATTFRADISRIVKYAPAELIGREAETKLLSDAWDKAVRGETKRPHMLTFVALGGEGKTSLVAKWAAELAHQDWPGCDAAFAWSFYSQGTRDQLAASADLFLKEALVFFGDDADKEFAASPAGAFEKGQRLARIVGQQRSLLILDGLEPLQYPPGPPMGGKLKDDGVAALLKGLAATSAGLCVVTTRYSIPDLRAYRQSNAPEVELLRLSREAGVHLLGSLGVNGSLLRNIQFKAGEQVNEFEKLVEDVQGHALTLNLLGSYLHDAHGGDIRKRDLVKLEEADAEEHGGHAFRVMDAYVQSFKQGGKTAEDKAKGRRALAVLRLLGLFDRPATADCLNALWTGEAIAGLTDPLIGLSEAQRNLSLTRLEDTKLLSVNRNSAGLLISLDAHPLIREYFARQVRRQHPTAWRSAHRRLYEHLCATTNEGDRPTLEDLQPLYQAVAHGCQAGLQQEACDDVYKAQIVRGSEFYSFRRLGAFGSDLSVVSGFYDEPWKKLMPTFLVNDQAWLLEMTAFCLRALGRLQEAGEPIRASMNLDIARNEWEGAAVSAGNLSELELTLGEVAAAVGDAEHSVNYADRSGEASCTINRTTHGDALHQAGRRGEAETRFREAEQLQAAHQPNYPLLYSVRGFKYCDLLLSASQRAAWQIVLELKTQNLTVETFIESCRIASQRAAQTLQWAELWQVDILSASLDDLTLGRAAFYEVVLSEGDFSFKTHNSKLRTSIDAVMDGLRRAGAQEFIVHGLLTRAWLRFFTGARTGPESAQEDLDEAWEIAERGPMRLFMADIHLYRARLFGGMKDEGGGMEYPWDKNPDGTQRGPKDDLAAARKLIEQCGYWRRKEELEDAEAAAKNW